VRPTEPELIRQLVHQSTAHFYATDSWVVRNGAPSSVAELVKADLLGFEPVERFAEHLNSVGIPITPDGFRIVSENGAVIWEHVRRGLGVGAMLREIAERTPGIIRLLPDLPGTPVPVWLVRHRELRTSQRVRLVFEILAEELRRCSISERPSSK
jgi:DNA-binding transcriptional LysR family regulator